MDTTNEMERTIRSTREFNVSREQLFEAWSNPEYLKSWWGPNGFTNTFHEFDFKLGGRWKFTMHGPDKGHYENEVEFTSIDAPSSIAWKRYSKPLFGVRVDFTLVDSNKTRLDFNMIFDTVEECAKLRPYVVDKNEENFDRLEKVLGWMGENNLSGKV